MKAFLNTTLIILIIATLLFCILTYCDVFPLGLYDYEPFNILRHIILFIDKHALLLLTVTWTLLIFLFYNDKLIIGSKTR